MQVAVQVTVHVVVHQSLCRRERLFAVWFGRDLSPTTPMAAQVPHAAGHAFFVLRIVHCATIDLYTPTLRALAHSSVYTTSNLSSVAHLTPHRPRWPRWPCRPRRPHRIMLSGCPGSLIGPPPSGTKDPYSPMPAGAAPNDVLQQRMGEVRTFFSEFGEFQVRR